MTAAVSLPFWLVAVLAVFAIVGITDRVFAPSARWFLRRRVNDAIDELNQRLDLRIQPFKLTRRQTLIDQLMYDPIVLEAVEAEALSAHMPRTVVMKRAERYAREIVPHFSVTAYFGFGTRVARWLSEFVYRVRLGYADDAALKAVDPNASVVFVMNHRSNMDYVLVTYMASSRASLSYAVGEWARIWILQTLIRSMGAYFIRRNSNDELYRKVLGRYVHMATRQGVTQAVFPEGGLTRDGKLRPPKLGLLSYMVADFDPKGMRDIVFVPVGINYDRVIEDRILTAASEKEITGRDFRVRSGAILSFLSNLIKLRLAGRLYRFGYACVSFGKPISLRKWQKTRRLDLNAPNRDKRFAAIEALGQDLIDEIGRIVPALPVSMVATVFLREGDRWMGELEIKSRVFQIIEALEARGVHVHIPRSDRDYAVGAGLRMLTLRHLVETDENGMMRANPRERVLLAYYANSIAHDLDAPAQG
ncbi:MAG: 1-acyl-sn-glycerol-3-phosphate acyltransferase [Rhizobiaceae bacterium]